jgi:hypothetical protein
LLSESHAFLLGEATAGNRSVFDNPGQLAMRKEETAEDTKS